MTLPQIMTAKEVCEFFGISKSTLYRIRKKNARFPKPKKIGGKDFYLTQSIREYLENNDAKT